MLLLLLAGVTHTIQHDVFGHSAYEVSESGDHANSNEFEEVDCLLADLAGGQAAFADLLISLVVLPRPLHPTHATLHHSLVGIYQARAPPASI